MTGVKLAVTFFSDYAATEKREECLGLHELADLICRTSAPEKAALPWLKLARFGNRRTEKGSLRHNSNLEAISGIEADYDGGVNPLETVLEAVERAGLTAIVYTSPSHTPEKPRWRILCPTSQDLPGERRAHLLDRLNGVVGGILAGESWTLSQSYYFGSVNGNPAHRVELVEGRAIDELKELDATAIPKNGGGGKGENGAHKSGSRSGDGDDALLEQIKTGETYHVAAMTLLGRWSRSGVTMVEAERRLRMAFECVLPVDRDKRWRDRYAGIPEMLAHVWGKDAAKVAEASAGPGPDLIARLGVGDWLSRYIPPLDRLLGDLLTTTSRVLLSAQTGIGKTNLCLAIAVAIGAGVDFLHWRCPSARRVLYVDGEMSERLMKQRLEDALRRIGDDPEVQRRVRENLFVLNRANFPDLPPLDSEAGRKYVDRIIELMGGTDLIVFDNIQALLSGSMKEEEPWKAVVPWTRDLTNRAIGQLWEHHVGHDKLKSYGTSTREWEMDCCILLDQVERETADIAFHVRFTKARERTPDNRRDFEPIIITLSNDVWKSETGTAETTKRTASERAFELLRDAIAREGVLPPTSDHIPWNTPCVTEGVWRRYCEAGCISEGSPDPAKKADADRKAFKRATEKLIGSKVGKWDLWVWIIR